jgi:mono/diheme cytochrome c family protein
MRFLLGIITGIVLTIAGAYLFVRGGGFPMETTAAPLPFEETLAGMAIRASMGTAAAVKDPNPPNESNLLAGAKVYRENCAFCHTAPGGQQSIASKGMSPKPPQLFAPNEMVTDDPEGIIFWIVTHGIRLSGMPGFGANLSDTQRWQVVMLLAHADKLPPAVQSALNR